MNPVIKTILFIAAAYIGIGGLAFAFQRKLQYFPATERVEPSEMGLEHVQEIVIPAGDGIRLINWYAPPPDGQKTIVFFQGNGGAIWHRHERFEAYRKAGFGVLFPSYRGYGGSEGSPSEKHLVADGLLAVDWLNRQGIAPQNIVLVGESLGSGVAVQVAAKRDVALVILEAPFASAVDIGASAYPWLPVRLFMTDQFRSDLHIANISAPLIVIHGDQDEVVPVASGRKLFKAAREPKRWMTISGAGHADLSVQAIFEREAEIIRGGFAEN